MSSALRIDSLSLPSGLTIENGDPGPGTRDIWGTIVPGTTLGTYTSSFTDTDDELSDTLTITVAKGPQTIVASQNSTETTIFNLTPGTAFTPDIYAKNGNSDRLGPGMGVWATDAPTLSYSGGNAGIATVHPTTGVITPIAVGTTTITVNSGATNSYNAAAPQTFTVVVKNMPEITGTNDLTLVKGSNTTVNASAAFSGINTTGIGSGLTGYSGLFPLGTVFDKYAGNHTGGTATGIYAGAVKVTTNASKNYVYSANMVQGLALGKYLIVASVAGNANNFTNYGADIGTLSVFSQPAVTGNFSTNAVVGGFGGAVTVPVNVTGGPFDGSILMTAELGSTGKTATATVNANGVANFTFTQADLNALAVGSYPINVFAPTTGYNNALAPTEVGVISAGMKTDQTITITPGSVNANVGDPVVSVTYGFDNTETPTVTAISSNPGVASADNAGNITIGSAGTAVIIVKTIETANFWAGSASFIVTVGKTAPTITWPTASTINYGDPLSDSALTGGSASVLGSFDWADPLETMTASGSRPVIFTPTNTNDYETMTSNVSLHIRSTDKAITGFTLNGVSGVISGTNISLTLPFGSDVTNLTPVITQTGASVTDDGVAKDFTNPVTYTVTAADGTTKIYTVTVSILYPTGNPQVMPASPIALDLNGSASSSFTVSLGMSGGGTMAERADITSDNPSVAAVSPGTLTTDGSVTVTATAVGSTTVTVKFYDASGEMGAHTASIPVTVSNSTPTAPPVVRPGGGSSGDYNGKNTPDTAPVLPGSSTGSGSYTGGNGLPKPGESVLTDSTKTGQAPAVGGRPAVGIISAAPNVRTGTSGSPANSSSEAAKQTAYTKAQFEKDWKLATANLGGKTAVLIRGINYSEVDASVLDYAYAQAKEKGITLQFHFDEVASRNTISRLYVTPAAKNSGYDLLGDKTTAAAVVKAFAGSYQNLVIAVAFENSGTTVRMAAEIPNRLTIANPVVYSYNPQAGTYTKVTNAKPWFDKNGYMHFTAVQGTYIISEGEIAKK